MFVCKCGYKSTFLKKQPILRRFEAGHEFIITKYNVGRPGQQWSIERQLILMKYMAGFGGVYFLCKCVTALTFVFLPKRKLLYFCADSYNEIDR